LKSQIGNQTLSEGFRRAADIDRATAIPPQEHRDLRTKAVEAFGLAGRRGSWPLNWISRAKLHLCSLMG